MKIKRHILLMYSMIIASALSLWSCTPAHKASIEDSNIDKVENVPSNSQSKPFERIFVRYQTPINGYDIHVECIMDTSLSIESVNGSNSYKSLLYIGTNSTIEYLGVVSLTFNHAFKASDYGKTINMEYKYPHLKDSKCFRLDEFDELPFFFMDIDMDGKDEFVVRGNHDGAYQSDTYSIYDLSSYDGELMKRRYMPFNELDSRSIIDFANNEIIIVHKSGIRLVHFKYKNIDGRWQLIGAS